MAIVRLPKDLYDLVTKSVDKKNVQVIPASSKSARFLSPKPPTKTEVEKCAENEIKTGLEKNSFRSLRINELEKMWNKDFIEHRKISPKCTGFISWDSSAEQQRGIA